MTVSGILVLAGMTILLPVLIGSVPASFLKGQERSLGMMWLCGSMVSLALFQILCTALIVCALQEGYLVLFAWYPRILAGLSGVGLLWLLLQFVWKKKSEKKPVREKKERTKAEMAAWTLFGILLVFQLFMAVFYTYGDGDDAYYVAVSTLTKGSQTMYEIYPYATGVMDLDVRHSLAPFPVWIAILSDCAGLRPVLVAHTLLPPVLIAMTYLIFYKLGELLFAGKRSRIPVFLSFLALLILFGDTASYTVENFMIARSRQGKAALGSIVIPMLFLLMLFVMKQLEEQKKTGWMPFFLMACTVTAGCLCTTLGAFLTCLLLGVLSLCIAVVYRKFSLLCKTFLACLPACIFAVLYLLAQ